MTKRVGIVVEKYDNEAMKIEGYLAESKVRLKIERFVKLEHDIIKTHFIIDLDSGGIKVAPGTSIWTAREIHEELVKAGFKNSKLIFNDIIYDIDGKEIGRLDR